MIKKLLAVFLALFLLSGCVSCVKPPNDIVDIPSDDNEDEDDDIDISQLLPIAVFTMDDGQEFEIELYKEVAPISVNNFVKLAKSGFYNGTLIHRITISGIFVIQGGGMFLDEDNNQYQKPANNIFGEFRNNGFENELRHEEGVISMARATQYNSASSQFFICYDDSSSLDGEYATFGRIRSGMSVVKQIARTPLSGESPIDNIIVKTVKIKYMKY